MKALKARGWGLSPAGGTAAGPYSRLPQISGAATIGTEGWAGLVRALWIQKSRNGKTMKEPDI